jgi:hypothetical protein
MLVGCKNCSRETYAGRAPRYLNCRTDQRRQSAVPIQNAISLTTCTKATAGNLPAVTRSLVRLSQATCRAALPWVEAPADAEPEDSSAADSGADSPAQVLPHAAGS